MNVDTLWLWIGFLGQGLFGARFLVQWLSSERSRRSVVPTTFWYLSLTGGVITLIYAIHQVEWPFILGQAMGLVVYIRNLVFIRRERRGLAGAAQP